MIVGMMSGIVPIMIKELSPVSVSGSTGAFHSFFITVGFFFGFALAYILSLSLEPEKYLFLVFGFTLLTTLLQQILLMTIYTNETPKYLLTQGRDEEALELIQKIFRPEFH